MRFRKSGFGLGEEGGWGGDGSWIVGAKKLLDYFQMKFQLDDITSCSHVNACRGKDQLAKGVCFSID